MKIRTIGSPSHALPPHGGYHQEQEECHYAWYVEQGPGESEDQEARYCSDECGTEGLAVTRLVEAP